MDKLMELMPDADFHKLVSDMLESYTRMACFVIDMNSAAERKDAKEWEYAQNRALDAMTGCRAIAELLEPALKARRS